MAQTWGLLIDWLGNDYAQRVIRSATQFCQARDISLVVFTVGRIGHAVDEDSFHKCLLPLLASPDIDRLLVCSAQFNTGSGGSLLETHLAHPFSKPVVCLGGQIANLMLVSPDIREVMNQLLDHLHKEHGYTKFAWVGGPRENPDCIQRENCFRNYLLNNNLHTPEHLFLAGDYGQQSGRNVGKILAGYQDEWDAVIAANDMMALGLQEILGANVPICGFDNDPIAAVMGITTIDLEVEVQVEHAMQVLSVLNSRTAPQSSISTVPTGRVLHRTSCGCSHPKKEFIDTNRASKSTTERIARFSENMLKCQDLVELERCLTHALSAEGVDYWKIIPPGNQGLISTEWQLVSPFVLIVHALYHEKELYGYLIHDLESQDYALSDWMRLDISLLFHAWHRKQNSVQVQSFLKDEMEKIKRGKQEIEKVINTLPLWIVEVDSHYVIRYLNEAAALIMGLSISDGRGKNIFQFIARSDADKVKHAFMEVQKNPHPFGCGFRLGTSERGYAAVVTEIQLLSESREANLATLFGSLHFSGGFRLTGFNFNAVVTHGTTSESQKYRQYKFSKREHEVINLLANGFDMKEIADGMAVSEATVRVHMHSLYIKAGVRNRKELLELLGFSRKVTMDSTAITPAMFSRLFS